MDQEHDQLLAGLCSKRIAEVGPRIAPAALFLDFAAKSFNVIDTAAVWKACRLWTIAAFLGTIKIDAAATIVPKQETKTICMPTTRRRPA